MMACADGEATAYLNIHFEKIYKDSKCSYGIVFACDVHPFVLLLANVL